MYLRLRAALAAVVIFVIPVRAEVVNRIIATIDGEPVTAHELDRFVADRKAESQDRRQALEALITDRILQAEIKSAGIEAKPAEVDRMVADIRTQNHMDEQQFAKAIKDQGFTMEQFRAHVKEELERNELVNREVRGRVNVSPQEIERYYEAHKDDYGSGGDNVTVSDILIRGQAEKPADVMALNEKAKAVAEEARAGDFAATARKYSMGPGRDEGGLLGTFTRDQLDPRMAAVAFKLKPGEVSDPIPTPTGFHIIRVERFGGGKPRKLDEVKDDIREELYRQQISSRFEDYLGKTLRARHHVEILD